MTGSPYATLEAESETLKPPPAGRFEPSPLPRIDKNMDDVVGLPPLPKDLHEDLSHALPCITQVGPVLGINLLMVSG